MISDWRWKECGWGANRDVVYRRLPLPLHSPAMRSVWRSIRYLFGFAEKVHTGIWLAEIVGILTLCTGIYAWVQRHIQQDINRFMIGVFFAAGLCLLVLPRSIYALYRRIRQEDLPPENDTRAPSRREFVKIKTIGFEYMKNSEGSPLSNNWSWAEKDESIGVIFRVPHDAPVAGSLAIIDFVFYGIDFTLEPNWILVDRLEYSAKYVGAGSAFYTRVTVGFKDGTKDEQIWIAHKVGKARPTPDGSNSKNWVVFLQGKPITYGWRFFDVSVSDEVRQIYQGRGGFLRHLTKFRLRGSLSISPIELYETSEMDH
jgi:hypothetical protein